MQEVTDADLALRSAKGDREAFTELVSRHKGSIVALIRRLVANANDVEDIVQETLLQSWLNVSSIRNPERIHAWLLQVARNKCRDWYKSASRRECPTEQQEMEFCVNKYGRAMSAGPAVEDLNEALCCLPSTEREAVELFYMQGLTIKEMCAVTQSHSGTVKSRLFTARHHLRSYFDCNDEKGENQ